MCLLPRAGSCKKISGGQAAENVQYSNAMEKQYEAMWDEWARERRIDVNRIRRAVEPDMHAVPWCRHQSPRGMRVADMKYSGEV